MHPDRDSIDFTELSGARFNVAMERLRAGHAVTHEGMEFVLGPKELCVVVPSTWDAQFVTEKGAEEDFACGEAILKELLDNSPEFRLVVGPRRIRYELMHDYGMGGLLLCWKDEAGMHWSEGFPRRTGQKR